LAEPETIFELKRSNEVKFLNSVSDNKIYGSVLMVSNPPLVNKNNGIIKHQLA